MVKKGYLVLVILFSVVLFLSCCGKVNRADSKLNRTSLEKDKINRHLTLFKLAKIQRDTEKVLAEEEKLKTPKLNKNTIAVCYFQDISPEKNHQAFRKALAFALIRDLSKIGFLNVVDRMRLQALLQEMEPDHTGSVDEQGAIRVGRLLGAEYVIIGKLVQDNNWRVDVSIVSVRNGNVIDTVSITVEKEKFYRLSGIIARKVAGSLGIDLTSEESKAIDVPLTTIHEAFIYFGYALDAIDTGEWMNARDLYWLAVKEDPKFFLSRKRIYSCPDPSSPGISRLRKMKRSELSSWIEESGNQNISARKEASGKTEEKSGQGNFRWYRNSLGMEFIYISPGTFMMGSPPDERGRDSDETQHLVTLTRGYFMQTTEVTVGQWRAFVKDTGYKSQAETGGGTWIWNGTAWEKMEKFYWDDPSYAQTDRHPVKCVSWNDVQAFVKWISYREQMNYRLPTEAEWEYACRAGATTAFSNGEITDLGCGYDPKLHETGFYCGNSGWKTHPVAGKKPNAWGLYDMHGNVWEWCQDWKGEYPSGYVIDPVGPTTGIHRVARGGSWDERARRCRSAFSGRLGPSGRSHRLGFRLAITP